MKSENEFESRLTDMEWNDRIAKNVLQRVEKRQKRNKIILTITSSLFLFVLAFGLVLDDTFSVFSDDITGQFIEIDPILQEVDDFVGFLED